MNKIEKILELKIDINDDMDALEFEDLGVDVISLVETPAIEVDFQYFNAEADFSPVDELSQCEEGSCTHERLELTEEAQNAILEYATENGEDITDEDVFINMEGFSFADVAGETGQEGNLLKSVISTIRNTLKGKTKILENEPLVYYRYTGPNAQRKFCKAMMNLSKAGRIYTKKQIDSMSKLNAQFAPKGRSSYSIFDYNGGVNCVHYWQRLSVFKNENGTKIVMTQGPQDGDEKAAKSQNKSKASPWGAIDNNARLNFSIEDEEKQIVVGPAVIPNKFIIRKDEMGNPYYVYFSAETIAKMAEKFLKMNKTNRTDLNHDGNIISDNTLLETWIKEDEQFDKSLKYGFDLPIGTWFVKYKLGNESWQLVKEGRVKGFSIAGEWISNYDFNSEEALMNKIKNILRNVKD